MYSIGGRLGGLSDSSPSILNRKNSPKIMTNAHVPSRTNTYKIECLPYSLLTLWKNATSVRINKNVSKTKEDNLGIMSQILDIVQLQRRDHQYAMKKDGAAATRQSVPNDIFGNTIARTVIIMAISPMKSVIIAPRMNLF